MSTEPLAFKGGAVAILSDLSRSEYLSEKGIMGYRMTWTKKG